MTVDEMEQVLQSVAERQERIASQQEVTAEQLTLANDILKRLAERNLTHEETLESHETRIKRFERSYTAILDLLASHDPQIDALTENMNRMTDNMSQMTLNINRITANMVLMSEEMAASGRSIDRLSDTVEKLGRTVDRYIAARNNGSGNGSL